MTLARCTLGCRRPGRIFIAVLGIIATAQFAHADSPSVTAVLNSSEAALGETVRLEIRVTGARGADAPEQIMVDGLEIRRTGTSQRIEMNNLKFNLQCGIRLYCDAVESGKIHDPASNHSRRKQFAAHPGVDIKRRGFVRSFVWRPAWP